MSEARAGRDFQRVIIALASESSASKGSRSAAATARTTSCNIVREPFGALLTRQKVVLHEIGDAPSPRFVRVAADVDAMDECQFSGRDVGHIDVEVQKAKRLLIKSKTKTQANTANNYSRRHDRCERSAWSPSARREVPKRLAWNHGGNQSEPRRRRAASTYDRLEWRSAKPTAG